MTQLLRQFAIRPIREDNDWNAQGTILEELRNLHPSGCNEQPKGQLPSIEELLRGRLQSRQALRERRQPGSPEGDEEYQKLAKLSGDWREAYITRDGIAVSPWGEAKFIPNAFDIDGPVVAWSMPDYHRENNEWVAKPSAVECLKGGIVLTDRTFERLPGELLPAQCTGADWIRGLRSDDVLAMKEPSQLRHPFWNIAVPDSATLLQYAKVEADPHLEGFRRYSHVMGVILPRPAQKATLYAAAVADWGANSSTVAPRELDRKTNLLYVIPHRRL